MGWESLPKDVASASWGWGRCGKGSKSGEEPDDDVANDVKLPPVAKADDVLPSVAKAEDVNWLSLVADDVKELPLPSPLSSWSSSSSARKDRGSVAAVDELEEEDEKGSSSPKNIGVGEVLLSCNKGEWRVLNEKWLEPNKGERGSSVECENGKVKSAESTSAVRTIETSKGGKDREQVK